MNRRRSPIKPGWLITYRKDGRLRGGSDPDDRQAALVSDVFYRKHSWWFGTASRVRVPASQVLGVSETNAEGAVVASWLTQYCGLDGKKSRKPRRPQLAELPVDQQEKIQQAFGLRTEIFNAFATCDWSPALFKRCWEQGDF